LMRPKGMTIEALQEGYYRFLREAYSLTGIMRRHRGAALDLPRAASHFARNYLFSRYGMIKTAHALKVRRRSRRRGFDRAPQPLEERSQRKPVHAARLRHADPAGDGAA